MDKAGSEADSREEKAGGGVGSFIVVLVGAVGLYLTPLLLVMGEQLLFHSRHLEHLLYRLHLREGLRVLYRPLALLLGFFLPED